MRAAKALSLKKERLAELTPDELQGVAGGETTTVSNIIDPCVTRTNPVCDRVSRMIQPCPTLDFC